MSADVIALLKQGLSPERLAEIRASGAEVEAHIDLSDLPLSEPQRGEEVVGRLTEQEAALFRIVYDEWQRIEEIEREVVGSGLRKMGDAIAAKREKELKPDTLDFSSDEQRAAYWAARQLHTYAHAMLHYTMGQRLGLHHWRLGVRSKNRIVKIQLR